MTGLIFRPKLGTPLGVSQQLSPIRELFRPDDALLQPLDGSWCNQLGTATCLALVPINSSIVLLIFSTIDEAVARTTIARGRAKQPQQQLTKTDLSRISNESTPPIYLFSHSKTFSNELLQISDPLETKKLPRGLLVPDFPFLSSKTWQNPGTKISPRIRILLCQIFKIASVQ